MNCYCKVTGNGIGRGEGVKKMSVSETGSATPVLIQRPCESKSSSKETYLSPWRREKAVKLPDLGMRSGCEWVGGCENDPE
jgi:hypothetical protein